MVEACGCSRLGPGAGSSPTSAAAPAHTPAPMDRSCTCPAALRDPRTVRLSCSRPWRGARPVLLPVPLTVIVCVLAVLVPLLAAGAAAGSDTEADGGGGHPPHHHLRHAHSNSSFPALSPRPAKQQQHSYHTQGQQLRRAERFPEEGEDDDDQEDADNLYSSSARPSTPRSATPMAAGTSPTSRTSCPSCRLRGELRSISLESIKEQILHKLNLQQAPNMTGRKIPKLAHLTELLDAHSRHSPSYGGMQGDDPGAFRPGPEVFEEEDNFHAKTERLIAFAQTHSNKMRHRWRGQNVLHFRFSQKVMQSQVAKATLWLWVRSSRAMGGVDEDPWGDTVSISVMRMQRGSGSQDSAQHAHSPEITVKLARPDGRGGWVTIDVKKLVEDWFRRPKDNLGLVVMASDSADRQVVSTDPNEEDGTLVPFVEVYLTDSRKRRVRRNVGLNCHENSEETRCCRYPLTVDFEAFGWDFIIAPKKYEANYCSGECPYIFMQKYPHTALAHLANREAGPCCAPRKMSAISMLYFDNDFNIVFGHLPGMVVDRCGCS